MTQTINLSETLLERAAAILRMKSTGLSLDWLKAFSIPQLTDCCDRMDTALSGIHVADTSLQRELIQNPAFAAYYTRLLPLFPEDPPEEKPEPTYHSGYGRSSRYYAPAPRPKPPSRRAVLMTRLCSLLEICRTHGRDVTTYPQERLMAVLGLDTLPDDTRLIFLEHFAELSEEVQQMAISSFLHCVGIPLDLTGREKSLLLEPFTSTRHLFATAPFREIADFLDGPLLDITRLLYEHQIREDLTANDYRGFAQDAPEVHRLLSVLIARLGPDATSVFLSHWQRSGCPLRELRNMERQTAEKPGQDWTELLAAYSGYVNVLYGEKFKEISLADTRPYQEDILIYAIVNSKKHFIRLLDDNAEMFLNLPGNSVLFQEKLYREHFNLNELTGKDLEDCAWMVQQKLKTESLAPGRCYTFPELRALYGLPGQYMTFYHLLRSDSQDYRLGVLRQLRKRDVLRRDMGDGDTAVLASCLDEKPLDGWMQADLGHISGLTACDAVRMLVHLDKLRPILPGIQTRTDALLVLRNLDTLEQCDSMETLKENLLQTDADWKALSERMGLTPEFQQRHKSSIVRFLCDNGAYIAETYCRSLGSRQSEAFLRVVKAELMGQLDALKYYEGDLQRELNTALTNRIKTGWRTNLGVEQDGLTVREHDDFISTMLLGTQPKRTCLSYIDGAYKECLLSAFDSNKKILYALVDGRIVGRAFLRLTKGRLTGADAPSGDSGFTFVDLENVKATRPERTREREGLTLFLERSYIASVGPETEQKIKRLFIQLAERKADALDTMLVLSADYRDKNMRGFTRTRYAVYISKSKAGAQYLDSLGAQAEVSSEGSYKANNFLVRERGSLPAASGF